MIERADDVLLVANQRRDGRLDWTPPGGVIDAGESLLEGLTREVHEETGLVVSEWDGPIYEITVDFVDLDMHLRVEAHRAAAWSGELELADPDGIVVHAGFLAVTEVEVRLASSPLWVREPLLAWLRDGAAPTEPFAYRAAGSDEGSLHVSRL